MLFSNSTIELSETDRAIYLYVIQHLDIVPFMSIRELSEAIPASQTAIWRFCKKLSCSGYAEFKFRLREHAKRKHSIMGSYDIDETAMIDFFKRSAERMLEDRIDQAARLLAEKEIAVFLGEGTSGIVAEYGATFFSGLFNLSLSAPHLLLNPSSRLNKGGENIGVIALSVSGENQKVINNLINFSEHGVPSILITSSQKCSAANIADICIPYYIASEKNLTADITSQVPALFLIEKLGRRTSSYIDAKSS